MLRDPSALIDALAEADQDEAGYDMIKVDADRDGMWVTLENRASSRRAETVFIPQPYTPDFHKRFCLVLKEHGWDVRPYDADNGFKAYLNNSHKFRVPAPRASKIRNTQTAHLRELPSGGRRGSRK